MSTDLACLVGPGDATKTTLLEAIGLALSRTFTVQFTDADFFDCDISSTIEIVVGIVELPLQLRQQRAFGDYLIGLKEDGGFENEVLDGTIPCLLIRLSVDHTLEPSWQVIRPNLSEGRLINSSQRQLLGFYRLGEHFDSHLRWGRSSALTDLTSRNSEARSVMALAQRIARKAVFDASHEDLGRASDLVHEKARSLGAGHRNALRPGLDPAGASTAHSLLLHDSDIPLTSFGLGTRRLTALSIQEQAVDGGAILAIDEVEQGLDPHRLARALRYLKTMGGENRAQVFFTTHSPFTVATLNHYHLYVVRSSNGTTTVTQVPPDLQDSQGAIRQSPHALLARRVIVGEGATETGFLRRFCEIWDDEIVDVSATTTLTQGTVVIDGNGGAQAVSRSLVFRSLGYETLLAMDNDDRSVDQRLSACSSAGVILVRCDIGFCLEQIIAQSLPIEGLNDFVAQAVILRGSDFIRSSISKHMHLRVTDPSTPEDWIAAGPDEITTRTAIGNASKDGWFKRQEGGEILADICYRHSASLSHTSLATYLDPVQTFAFGGGPTPVQSPTSVSS